MAEQVDLSPKQVGTFLDVLIETATTQTREAGVYDSRLGQARKDERAAHTGRNPAIGESIKIAAQTTVKFRLSIAAKDAVVPSKK